MLKGFGQFLMRGNVVDLAVAVVIGGAFGAIVTALVKDLITPLIAADLRQAGLLGDQVPNQQQQFSRSAISSTPS
jgi:large conductance mechanosensitive channel